MKSKVFKKNKLEGDRINELKNLSKIPNNIFSEAYGYLSEAFEIGFHLNLENLFPIAEKIDISAREIYEAIDTGLRFIKKINKEDDSLEAFIEDVVELEYIEAENKENLKKNIEFLQQEYKEKLRYKDYENEILYTSNRLIGLTTKCEIVPKFEPSFDSTKHDIEDFSTKIVELIPILRIILGYYNDAVDKEYISFSVNEEILDDLIKQLIAAKLSLGEAKKIKL